MPARLGALKRLAFFVADLEGGGAERMMVALAAGAASRGVDVDLVAARAVGPYVAEVPSTVRLVDLGAGGTLAAVPPLARYLRTSRPDLLLSTLHHASVAAEAARRLAGGRTVHVVREANTPSGDPLARASAKLRAQAVAMRVTYALADGVVAVSEGVADDLRRHYAVPDRKLWTLYNPVVGPDLADRAALDPGHPWFAPGEPPVVLGVGSLQPRKGFATLIDAFARVRARRPVRLVVLGEGAQRAELQARAAAAGVAADVALPGFVANPFAFMARAGVFVLASEREGLPGVLIQALACGCPVVATDCPSGPSEILEGGRHGALVPVGDVGAMAAAIERTLDAVPDRDALRARAARFDAATVTDAHLDRFDQLVAGRRRRTPTAAARPGATP